MKDANPRILGLRREMENQEEQNKKTGRVKSVNT